MGLTTAELAEVVGEGLSAAEAADAAAAVTAGEAAGDAAAAGGTTAGSSTLVEGAIAAAKSIAVSFVMGKLFSRDTNLSNGGTAQSFLANTLSSADPIPVIYGRRRVGASVVEVALTPTLVQADNLHRVCIWGEGAISAVSALYMDAVVSTDDRYQQGGNPAFVAEHHLGADDQAASAYMIANIADAAKWNASCTLSGIAYSYVTMVWNPTVFTHGRPVMTADVDGRTLTDPRTGTVAFSRNPALAIRDYLVNARYGRGVDTSMIDDTAIAEAAWHCEDQTSVPDGAGGTTLQARYTCDGVLNVDQPVLDNLRALLTSCRGFLVFSGGKYKLKIDRGYWALQFNDSNSYVEVASVAALKYTGGNFTFECWFSIPASETNGGYLFSKPWNGAGEYNYNVVYTATRQLAVTIWGATSFTSAVSAAVSADVMHHAVLVLKSDKSVVLYIDGVAAISTAHVIASWVPPTGDANLPLALGTLYPYGLAPWDHPDYTMAGKLDAVRVYSGRALTAAEAAEHFKGAFRDETGLVGRWEFDEGQGATAYDWSGQGNHGVLRNGLLYTTQVPGYMLKFVLNADNIVGGWSIALGGKRNRFNRVRARFFNRDAAWQPDYAVFEDLAHRAADAGQVLEQTLDLPYTASAYTAAQIAQIEERRSRYGTLVSLTATIAATCLEVGDVVPVAHATPGWPAAGDPAEGKLFRVIEMELLSSDEVRLTLLEYQASVYQLSTPSQVRTVAQTSLPDMSIAATPGAPAVAEVLYQTTSSAGFKSRATLTWGAANDAFVQSGGWYQLERSPQGAGTWTIYPQIPSPGRGVATVSFTVDDVSPGTYDWRVAAFNSIGAKSAYSPITTKEIAGLNAPPSNVANFAVQSYSGQAKFTWDKPSTATDLAVVQSGRIYVRWSPKTSGAAWDSGSLVNPDGYPGDTSIGFGPLITGTYMAKLWNGRAFSVTEATFVVTEALITGLVTLATVDEAPAFAGAKSNVAAVDAGIQLDGTTLIDAMLTNIDTWSALDSLGGVHGSGSYSFANTLDLGSKQAARLVSNIDSLGFSTDDMVDSRTDPIDNWGMVDGDPIEDAEVSLWTRHTDDDPAGAPAWSAWERLGHVADFNFRAFQFRLDFATGSPTHNRRVSALSVTAKH